MKSDSKNRLLENLAFAGALGAVALALLAVGFFADLRHAAFERSALSSLARRPIAVKPIATRDPDFSRMYRVGGKGPTLFGAVVSFRTSRGAALSAALFAPDGELEAVRLIDIDVSREPYLSGNWFAAFLGRGGRLEYPSSKGSARDPAAVSGSTESFLAVGRTLGRASAAVRIAAEANP